MINKDPSYNIAEIPDSKDPSWKNEEDRYRFQEDLRLHIYDALDYLDSPDISEKERNEWEYVVTALGNLAEFYKSKGYYIHVH